MFELYVSVQKFYKGNLDGLWEKVTILDMTIDRQCTCFYPVDKRVGWCQDEASQKRNCNSLRSSLQ